MYIYREIREREKKEEKEKWKWKDWKSLSEKEEPNGEKRVKDTNKHMQ